MKNLKQKWYSMSSLCQIVFLHFFFVSLSQSESRNSENLINKFARLNSSEDHRIFGNSQLLGFLEIQLDWSFSRDRQTSPSKNHKSSFTPNDKSSLKVCLASKNSENEWVLDDCLMAISVSSKIFPDQKGGQFITLQRFGLLQFTISQKIKSTHLVVRTMRSDSDQDLFYWTDLPFQSSSNGVSDQLTLTPSENADKSLVTATVILSCAPNQYGPRCTTTCSPPNEQYRCDSLTGELKCIPGWIGRHCEHQIFISNEVASQFIKHRSKRRNSLHHFEEFQGGNIERECEEEKCSREEAREAFEDNALTAAYWRVYTDTNQCRPYPCVITNSVRCEDLIGNYACHCKPGYKGKKCQYEIDICQSGPCHNGGTCQRHGLTSFACICPIGFRGSTCNLNIDDCVESNCGLYGTCVDGINDFTCTCDAGFTGMECDININECEDNPCQNGGNCSDHIAFYTCQCPAEYDGQNCDNRINPCISSPCKNDGKCILNEEDYSYTCTCTSLFTGNRCQHAVGSVCAAEPCSNGGTCFVDQKELNVVEDTSQSSNIAQEFTCICPIGYRGDTCEEIINPCELGPDDLCPFNSTCFGLNRQYICVCSDGFTGALCQTPGNDNDVDKLRCQDNPCLNEARCIHHNNATTCICRAGFNGTRCENEVDFCQSSPCIHKGECIPAPNGFYCNCAKGHRGRYCEEDIDECTLMKGLCQNGGSCNNTDGSFQCICGPYNTGRYCETPFDPCDAVPCGNGGTCSHTNSVNGYMCDCVAGYGGNDCNDVIDPCTDVTNPCLNNAGCSPNPDLASEAICTCLEGYYGRTCAKETDNCAVPSNITRNLNGKSLPQLVERSDCGKNGDCVSTEEGFICYCNRGFDGDRCQQVYLAPVVNCTSETCQCPAYLVDEVLYHDANSTLACQYQHYDQGACKKVTCIASSCPISSVDYQCNWRSGCLEKFVSGVSKGTQMNSTELCPVIEVVLDRKKLLEGTVTEEFCSRVRELPSYRRRSTFATIHCTSYEMNEANVTIAIAMDSISSQDQSVLLAFNIFQRLEQEFVNSSDSEPNPLAEDLDPIFSAILSMRFGGSLGRVQNGNDDRSKPKSPSSSPQEFLGLGYNIFFIIIPIVVLLIIIVIIVLCVRKRKRQRKELQVMYVANPPNQSHNEENDSDQASMTTSRSNHGSPLKKSKLKDDLVNPLLVEGPTYNGLLSRPAAESNPYVATPYATSLSFSPSNSSGQSSKKSVEEATIDFGVELSRLGPLNSQYEDMHGVTRSFTSDRPSVSTSDTVYSFAQDAVAPGHGKKSHRTRASTEKQKFDNRLSSAYEEIAINRLPVLKDNPYETVEYIGPSPPSEPRGKIFKLESSKQRAAASEEQYNFATEVPKVGVPPSPFVSRRSTKEEESCDKETETISNNRSGSDPLSVTTSGDDSGIEVLITSESSSPVIESRKVESKRENYQTPNSLFPQNDDLFFPSRNTELPDVYAVPRHANPADKSL